jgi:GTPase
MDFYKIHAFYLNLLDDSIMKLPLVVIIGRPNVGKSTLFNRLVGKREAIVDDISGVTRDRNYQEVEWAGKRFNLIDTGGYVPNSEEIFETAIREQIKIAIKEADSILFVVDARAGINPMDEEILRILRSSAKDIHNKKFFLIANKVDSAEYEKYAAEFYKLGTEKVYDISALGGRKIGDLLDEITKDFPKIIEEAEDVRLKITIVGRPNVGKSSLANALLGYDRSIVTDIPGTTRDSVDSILKYYGKEIILIDTAGLRKKKKVEENIEFFSTIRTLKTIEECDVAIILLDSQVGFDKQDQKIIDEAVKRHKGIIIAVNKWDLVKKDTNTSRIYEKDIYFKLGTNNFIPVIFISALTKQRIYKLLDMAFKIKNEKNKNIPTSELNDTILAEVDRNPPPSTKSGKEIKIKYITQAKKNFPLFLFFTNYPKDIVEHYKRFLEKMIRQKFGFEGVPISISFRKK